MIGKRRRMAVCGHCGRETGITYGAIWDKETSVKLCHTGDPGRPDCYRRVTVYHEYLGILKGVDPLPEDVKDIRDDGMDYLKGKMI